MIHQIHIPTDMKPMPSAEEMLVARVLADYFKSDVKFIKRSNIAETADLKIKNVIWEIKSPLGDGKRTMQNNLRKADNQSPNIIINLSRCKMPMQRAVSRIKHELNRANSIKRLIIITKAGIVIVLK